MLALGLIFRSWVAAQARTAVVLATVMQIPLAQAFAGTPRVTETAIAGVPTMVVAPPGDGPWPAMVFITGADADGRHNADVVRLARGLARAGFIAIVPDLPGLASAQVTQNTLVAGALVIRDAALRADVKGGKVAISSVSTGASLALLIAERPEAHGRVRAIAGIAPFADIRHVLMIATTGYYRDAGGEFERYETDVYIKEAIARSLLAALPEGRLPIGVETIFERVGADSADAFAPVRELQSLPLRGDAAAVVNLLSNRDPRDFGALYNKLSVGLRSHIDALSPIHKAHTLDFPVELATSPQDKYFPITESEELVARLPQGHVVITSALNHVIPEPSIGSLDSFAQLDWFIVRSLKAARD